jgi:HD-GYP domain-containing protein (c-di-GMP phosphodiesterase class II)
MDSIANFYREINLEFLISVQQEDADFEFEVHCQAESGDPEKFVLFGNYTQETHAKFVDRVESGNQKYFIHETDLIKRYEFLLTEKLMEELSMGSPSIEILKKAYQISRQIMKEYFDNLGSMRILRTLESAIQIIETCLNRGNLEFIDVYDLTDKENNHYSHCVNNALYCMIFGRRLEMDRKDLWELGLGGMLFDIGKKDIPDEIFSKEGKLTDEEFKAIRKHPMAGKSTLLEMKCYTNRIYEMASQHHEKYDGSGYPNKLKGEDISYFARICAITDVFDALLCQRHHRDSLTPFDALMEMKEKMPGHFDQQILETFLHAFATTQQAA